MEEQPQPSTGFTNTQTILFMVALSFACALILAALASALAEPQELAKDLDRSKQMMIAAKLLDHNGYFLIKEKGKYIPAKLDAQGVLVPGSVEDRATSKQILEMYKRRFEPLLVDKEGNTKTFKESNTSLEEYIAQYKKRGYYRAPLKLIYEILPNQPVSAEVSQAAQKPVLQKVEGFVIPVNGYGLWDAIYGYLAIEPDADTVIGISWYEQVETPGLGANIADAPWQSLFPGKKIFQESASGETDFNTAPVGITVVKGKVSDVLGSSPKSFSAVDGMAGATLTGNGVTDAYRDVLAAYRPFLVKQHQQYASKDKQ